MLLVDTMYREKYPKVSHIEKKVTKNYISTLSNKFCKLFTND